MGKQITRYEHQLGANHTQYDRSMSRSANETRKLSNQQRSLAASVALIDGPLGGVASRVSNFNTLLSKSGLALGAATVGLAGLGFGATKAIKELAAFEVSQQRISNLLTQTGFAAGRTTSQIEELAQVEGFRTLADVNDVREAAAVLTSYGSIVGDVFDRTIALGNDAAQVFGGTVSSSVKLLARALDDPADGIERLERRFGALDDSVKATVISLANQGKLFEAQDALLESLESRLGGAGDGEGISFSLDTLSQSAGNLFVTLGQVTGASSAVSGFFDILSKAANGIETFINPSIESLEKKIRGVEKSGIEMFNGELAGLRQELDVLKQQEAAEQARRLEVEKAAQAKRDEAVATRIAAEQQEALLELFRDVDQQEEEFEEKRKKALEKAAREAAANEKRLASQIARSEAEIETIRISSLDPIEKINAEHQRTIDRLETIKRLTPSLAQDVDNVIPIASARNAQDQKDAYERLLNSELNRAPRLDVDPEDVGAEDRLFEQYNQRRSIIDQFAQDEILAHEAKTEAMLKLDQEYAEQSAQIDALRWEVAESAMFDALTNLSALMNSHSRTMFNIGKVAAIAETVINTYKGATAAYAALAPIPVIGPALGTAAAAAAIAAGVANVQQIKNRSFGDKSVPTVAGGGAVGTVAGANSVGGGNDIQDSRAGVEIILNGNYNGDPELLANAIKDVIDGTDFVLVEAESRNGQELRAA